jgi:indolepyruvate ferredoxin oxidoreductase beta subunit
MIMKIKKTGTKVKPDEITNIVVTGIGGQGGVSLALIIAEAAMASGYNVMMSELHGLSQRFGHLESHVRFSKGTVHTSVVPKGEADVVIALEPLEGLRAIKFMDKKRTAVLLDTKPAKPVAMDLQNINYPEIRTIVKTIKPFAKSAEAVNASDIVKKQTGTAIQANVYLLGKAMKKGLIRLDRKKIFGIIKQLPSPETNEQILKFALK